MNKREDYEHLEREVDGSYYWWINSDVVYLGVLSDIDKSLNEITKYFYREELKAKDHSLYCKGTRLYFTYKGVKYHFSWVFYSKEFINETVRKLKLIGASNIQINYGELD